MSNTDKSITERIGVHKVALAFLQEFEWFDREQPILDYGIDMHVEIANNGKPTGQLFAIQIKSGKSYFGKKKRENNHIKFKGKNKHLDYWTEHSLPVLIILYNPNKDSIIWELVTREKIKVFDKSWKILIPENQTLTKNYKEKLKQAFTNPNHYTIINHGDNSFGNKRRVEAKILVESKYARSKTSMREMIPQLVQRLKKSDYYKNERFEKKFENQNAHVVFLLFYNNYQQVTRGLPFCRAVWNEPNYSEKFNPFTEDENVNNIAIKWDSKDENLGDSIVENEIPKGRYLKIVDRIYAQAVNIYQNIIENQESRNEQILEKSSEIRNLYQNNNNTEYPPVECQQIDKLLQEICALLDNLVFYVKNENIMLIDRDLKEINDKLSYFRYERKKAK